MCPDYLHHIRISTIRFFLAKLGISSLRDTSVCGFQGQAGEGCTTRSEHGGLAFTEDTDDERIQYNTETVFAYLLYMNNRTISNKLYQISYLHFSGRRVGGVGKESWIKNLQVWSSVN